MIKPEFKFSSWGLPGELSGGFHLGPFFEWEPWLVTIGLDLGFWCAGIEFRRLWNEERSKRLQEKAEKAKEQ